MSSEMPSELFIMLQHSLVIFYRRPIVKDEDRIGDGAKLPKSLAVSCDEMFNECSNESKARLASHQDRSYARTSFSTLLQPSIQRPKCEKN